MHHAANVARISFFASRVISDLSACSILPMVFLLKASIAVEGCLIVSRHSSRAKTIRRTSLKVRGAGKKRTDHACHQH
jgi:hypothetical protein